MIKVRKVEVAVIIVKLIVIDCNENDKNKKREGGREGEVRLNRTGVFNYLKYLFVSDWLKSSAYSA